jgi:hypothetical protein
LGLAPGVKSLGDLRQSQAAQEAQALMQSGFMPGIEQPDDGIKRNAIARGYTIEAPEDPSVNPNGFVAKRNVGGIADQFTINGDKRIFTRDQNRAKYTVIK